MGMRYEQSLHAGAACYRAAASWPTEKGAATQHYPGHMYQLMLSLSTAVFYSINELFGSLSLSLKHTHTLSPNHPRRTNHLVGQAAVVH